jgi:hypothetical protein
MKRIALIVGGGLIAAVSLIGVAYAHNGAHEESDDKPTTIVGEVIDTACFTASDGDAKGKDHAECAQKCLASGIPVGILPDGKGEGDALVLLTNPKPFAPYAAQTIKVEGVVNSAKHLIDVKKAYVKDGDNWKEIQLDDEHHKMGGEKKEDGHKH